MEFFKFFSSQEKKEGELSIDGILSLFHENNISIHPTLRGETDEETKTKLLNRIEQQRGDGTMQIVLTSDFGDGIRLVENEGELMITTCNDFLDAERGIISGSEGKRIKKLNKTFSRKKVALQ